MVKLIDHRPLITIELPSYPGSKVNIRKGIKIGDQISLAEKYPNASDATHPDAQKLGLELLVKSIESWNFTDEQDKPLPVSIDSIYELGLDDLQVLMGAINEEKKK